MDEWQQVPFSEAVLINPSIRLKNGEKYPFIDMASIEPALKRVFAKEEREFTGGGSRFRSGDTLMARITPCLENGKIGQFSSDDPDTIAYGSTEFIVVRGKPTVSETDFAYYLIKWEHVRNYAIGQMTGTSGRQRVPANAFTQLMVPLPSLPEQRAIASTLGALDDKIDLNRRMNETLEAMARAIFKDWFVDFGPIRAKAESRPPYLAPDLWALFPDALDDENKPVGWEEKRVDDILELVYGKALKASDRADGPVPVYGSGGITGYHSMALVEGPSVIVGRKGTVGSLYWEDGPFFPIDTVFYVKPKTPLTFCFYLLQKLGLDGMNTDAAVPGLNRNNVYRLPVVWSQNDLRIKFDRIVNLLRQKMCKNSEESQTLAQLRDFLLPKLMSGEIRLRDAEKMVEAVA